MFSLSHSPAKADAPNAYTTEVFCWLNPVLPNPEIYVQRETIQ